MILPLHGTLSPLGMANKRPASALLDSLISYWKLDETSDGSGPVTRVDSVVASGNDLTDNNTTASGTGKINNGASLVKANGEYLSRPSNALLQTGDIDFTLCCWVKFASITGSAQALVTKDGQVPREYMLSYFTGIQRFRFLWALTSPVVDANALGPASAGVWYFVVAWHDAAADTFNIQVNDGGVDSVSDGGGLSGAGGAPLQVGAWIGTSTPDGVIDEVGFWKRVLTAAERTQLYNGGNGLSYPF